MTNIKKKTLHVAMLAAIVAMGSSTANAVHVNPAGLGQALIYPYYTARSAGAGPYNTYLSIVNTTASVKAVKVRFLEGKAGKPVLDFNLYLSPFDVWAGAVVPVNAADPAQGAKLVTVDNSCTVPAYKGNESAFVFSNAAYAGTDAETASLDRTNEGHFEIIEMGEMIGTITTGLLHTASGVPANCAVLGGKAGAVDESKVVNAVFVNGVNTNNGNVKWGTGGLGGSASLINVNNGTDYSYTPVALADFNTVASMWSASGSVLPNLSSAQPKTSKILDEDGSVIVSDWTAATDNPADPVSAVLMAYNMVNEFVLDTATLSGTDWVVTFPTKSFYVGNDSLSATGARLNTVAMRPFQSNFGSGGACDLGAPIFFDREEAISSIGGIAIPPPGELNFVLCWQANVMTFTNRASVPSNLLGSKNARLAGSVLTPFPKYENGWAAINFRPVDRGSPEARRMRTAAGNTVKLTKLSGQTAPTYVQGSGEYFGLPAVGFMLHDFINGKVGSPPVMSSYGGNFDHKAWRLINVTP